MKLLKLPLKLLLLPCILVFGTIIVLGKLASNISSYAVSLLMLLIFICGIMTVCQNQWNQTMLLFGAEVICFTIIFFMTLVINFIWREKICMQLK